MANLIRLKQINTSEISGFIGQVINEGQIPVFITYTGEYLVLQTGNQIISGLKTFRTRPEVNGTGVLLIGEAVGQDLQNIVLQTGNQVISGLKNFNTRPQVNGTNVVLVGEALPDVPSGFLVLTTGDQIISGLKTFRTRPTINGSGIVTLNEAVNVSDITQLISGTKVITNTLGLGNIDNTAARISIYSETGPIYISGYTIDANSSDEKKHIVLTDEYNSSSIFIDVTNKIISGSPTGTLIRFINNINAPNLVYNTGTQIISGRKDFNERPTIQNILPLLASGDVPSSGTLSLTGNQLSYNIQVLSGSSVLTYSNQNISGNKTFTTRPTVNNTGVLISGDADKTEIAWFSWTPSSDQNLGQAVDIFPPWNNQRYNSSTNTFELFNSGGANPAARIAIKQPGYYEMGFQYYGYDLKLNNDVTIKLHRSTQPNTAFSLVRWTSKTRFSQGDSVGDSFESWTNTYITSTGYYTMTMLSSGLNPYTIRGDDASFGMPTFSFHLTKLRNI